MNRNLVERIAKVVNAKFEGMALSGDDGREWVDTVVADAIMLYTGEQSIEDWEREFA